MTTSKTIYAFSIVGLVLTGCQPQVIESQDLATEKASSEPVPIAVEPTRLIAENKQLNFQLPVCSGNNCQQLVVERLQSNYPFIDQVIDQEVTDLFRNIVEPVLTTPSTQSASLAASSEINPNPQQHLEQILQPYVQSFLNLDKELKNLSGNHQLTLMIRPRVLSDQPPLITIALNSNQYLGGAHGATSQHYYHFDLEHQRQIQLADLVLPQKMPELEKKVYDAFKSWVIEAELADSVEEYEQVWKFHRTDNFYLSTQGLVLQYEEYEIGPYIVGFPRFVIAYEDLNQILKPHYLPNNKQLSTQRLSS